LGVFTLALLALSAAVLLLHVAVRATLHLRPPTLLWWVGLRQLPVRRVRPRCRWCSSPPQAAGSGPPTGPWPRSTAWSASPHRTSTRPRSTALTRTCVRRNGRPPARRAGEPFRSSRGEGARL